MSEHPCEGAAESSGVGPPPELHFTCERTDLEAQGTSHLLGSYDGRDARDLHAYAAQPGDEQLLVSIHEQLHHELQWSTGWGLVAAMAGLLAASAADPGRLKSVATQANRRARQVHEIFATTISVGVLGVPKGRELMQGNIRYLGYLDQGLSLGGDHRRWPWQFRESAIQMLLRTLMQPRELIIAAKAGFESMTGAALRGIVPPDKRLARSGSAGTWWDQTFTEILQARPDRGGDGGDEWGRLLPEDPSQMERLKEFEETILIPRLGEVARSELRALGLESLDDDEYLEVVDLLSSSFQRLAPDDWQVQVLTERRAMNQEPLGAERERILIHEAPAQADVVGPEQLNDGRFLLRVDDFQPTVLALYLPGSTYAAQLGMADLDEVPVILGLAGWPYRDDDGRRRVPLALLNPQTQLRMVCDAFRPLAVTVLTSLQVTRQEKCRTQVLDCDEVFVLVDLPLNLQVEQWTRDGWTVRFAAIDLKGSPGLSLILLNLDELPGVHFLAHRSAAGFGEIAQLLDRHLGQFSGGLKPPQDLIERLAIISSWLLSAWWRIQEAPGT